MSGGIVNERLYHLYSYFTTICSLFSNALLIFVVTSIKLKHVGPYRWMLFSFAVMDMLISLIHSSIFPAIHMTEFGYIFWGYRLLDKSTTVGFAGSLCWVFLFYQSFALLAFHYVYRYVVLCNPPWVAWLQLNPWRNWPILLVTADIVYSVSVCGSIGVGWGPSDISRHAFAPILKETYGFDLLADNRPGFLAQPYWVRLDNGEKEWQWANIAILAIAFVVIFGTLGVITFCCIRILREMSNTTKNFAESNTRHMQRQLVRALMWQTIVPTVTSYIPICITVLVPLFCEVSLGGMGTIFLMSMELFPIIDPLLIIFFATGYRDALLRVIRKTMFGASLAPVSSTSSQAWSGEAQS